MPRIADMTDADLSAWTTNFATVVGAVPADYGLTAAQVTAIQSANTDLQEKMTARFAAIEAANAAIAAQKNCRETLESQASYYNTIIKASKTITDAEKEAAGIDIKKPATHTPPTIPTDLTVRGFDYGTNFLRWKRAGNKPGTKSLSSIVKPPKPSLNISTRPPRSLTNTRASHPECSAPTASKPNAPGNRPHIPTPPSFI